MGIKQTLNNAREYIAPHTAQESEIFGILAAAAADAAAGNPPAGPAPGGSDAPGGSAAVGAAARRMYMDERLLYSAMAAKGANITQIHQVCIMTHVSGFRELMEADGRTGQADIDRYLMNAVAETGLCREKVFEIAAAIAASAGIAVAYTPAEHAELSEGGAGTYVIPASVYGDEIGYFDGLFANRRMNDLSPEDERKLEVLANAGIAKAKFYLAWRIFSRSDIQPEEEAHAVQLLSEAAESGDSASAARLGDYYFEKADSDSWGKAYHYYTGYGTMALGEQRRKSVVSILNQKKFNGKMLVSSAVLLVFMLVSVFLAPASGVYGTCYIFGVICMLCGALTELVAYLHYKREPYDGMYWLPVVMFFFWTAYMAARLLF